MSIVAIHYCTCDPVALVFLFNSQSLISSGIYINIKCADIDIISLIRCNKCVLVRENNTAVLLCMYWRIIHGLYHILTVHAITQNAVNNGI